MPLPMKSWQTGGYDSLNFPQLLLAPRKSFDILALYKSDYYYYYYYKVATHSVLQLHLHQVMIVHDFPGKGVLIVLGGCKLASL